jgi:hypothetical protein
MIEYHKINTMFKRDMEGNKKIVEGQWVIPELEYLKDNRWVFTEKIDGTNIRVHWDGENINYGGRTDGAQVPSHIINRLNELFYSTPARMRLKEVFPEGGVLFYGEGCGPKIQSGSKYGSEHNFVLFDIEVKTDEGFLYLERPNVEDVARRLQLDIVPVVGEGTLDEGIQMVKDGFKSTFGDFTAEGLVVRPAVELRDRRGNRIITKIKHKDFR